MKTPLCYIVHNVIKYIQTEMLTSIRKVVSLLHLRNISPKIGFPNSSEYQIVFLRTSYKQNLRKKLFVIVRNLVRSYPTGVTSEMSPAVWPLMASATLSVEYMSIGVLYVVMTAEPGPPVLGFGLRAGGVSSKFGRFNICWYLGITSCLKYRRHNSTINNLSLGH